MPSNKFSLLARFRGSSLSALTDLETFTAECPSLAADDTTGFQEAEDRFLCKLYHDKCDEFDIDPTRRHQWEREAITLIRRSPPKTRSQWLNLFGMAMAGPEPKARSSKFITGIPIELIGTAGAPTPLEELIARESHAIDQARRDADGLMSPMIRMDKITRDEVGLMAYMLQAMDEEPPSPAVEETLIAQYDAKADSRGRPTSRRAERPQAGINRIAEKFGLKPNTLSRQVNRYCAKIIDRAQELMCARPLISASD